MSYEIKLDVFEGPLDLLLYLIRKNEIDIYNIPIALIAEQYLLCVEEMRSLNLDLAGEYLVLASTLIHIKSKMLLPPAEGEEGEEEEADPRTELVRQLLEYQAFKEAALSLDGRPLLERDVFTRGAPSEEEPETTGETALEDAPIEIDIFDLVTAFRRMVAGLDPKEELEIDTEKISLADRIHEILERLQEAGPVTFAELLGDRNDRRRIIYTFLAILELMKLRMIKAFQTNSFGTIRLFPAVEE